MRIKKILIVCCVFLFSKFYSAHEFSTKIYVVSEHSLEIVDSILVSSSEEQNLFSAEKKRPSPFFQRFHSKHKKNKKLTAAILAFPLPFGIVGLHRIYLGSAPYVPVVYIASFGGVLGLLPLIDFFFILLEKDTEIYTNNKKVFMWVK